MFLINGNAGAGSHEHHSVPSTVSRSGPDPQIQLALLPDYSCEHRCGFSVSAVFIESRPHGTFAGCCIGVVLVSFFTAGVALCLRTFSSLRSELDSLGSLSDASALD